MTAIADTDNMKLLRYGPTGDERPGLVDADGVLRDLGAHLTDVDAATLAPESLDRLAAIDPLSLPAIGGNPRLGPPIAPRAVGKLVGIGLNYEDHAAETGGPIPSEPVMFLKATSAIVGPVDPIVLPRGSVKADWEVELAFVIGRRARYVERAEALAHVAGFMVLNDISERTLQLERGGQWTKGKSCDTFAPIGPWLVTRDEVGDPANLALWCDVDGERMQTGHSGRMIFDVPTIVAYLSTIFTLEPGDIVTTGTPPGVGAGRTPPVFLRADQTIVSGIDKLGQMRNVVVAG